VKTCKIKGCDRPATIKDLCPTCYERSRYAKRAGKKFEYRLSEKALTNRKTRNSKKPEHRKTRAAADRIWVIVFGDLAERRNHEAMSQL